MGSEPLEDVMANCLQKEVTTPNHILKNLRDTKAEQTFLPSDTLWDIKYAYLWEQNMCKNCSSYSEDPEETGVSDTEKQN